MCYHIRNTTEVTAIDVTCLQQKNVQIEPSNGINTRTDVTVRPKSSLCTYTSKNIPVNVLKVHIITVIMYAA